MDLRLSFTLVRLSATVLTICMVLQWTIFPLCECGGGGSDGGGVIGGSTDVDWADDDDDPGKFSIFCYFSRLHRHGRMQ